MRRVASGGCTLPIKPDKAAHVVGDIGETDFDPRAGKRDRSDKEAYQSVLMRKHMFDRRTDLRFSRIGDPHAFRDQAALRLLAMDARDEAALGQHLLVLLRSIGGVCPNITCGVFLVQQIGQSRAVKGRCVARCPFADQAMTAIYRDMVLVAECRNRKIDLWRATLFRLGLGVFDRPAGIAFLLA